MTRWKILVEYDGGPFFGWQRQEAGVPTVQGAVEAAIMAFCQQNSTVHGAGRTDAGVHAAGQVAHFDLSRPCAPNVLCNALNAHLRPAPIAVLDAQAVGPDFHARFSAQEKVYLYRMLVRVAPPALDAGRVWHLRRPLDVQAMRRACAALKGRHDFSAFRGSQCQAKSPIRTLDELRIEEDGQEVLLWARARSFLHNQVRILAGTLAKIGRGTWTAQDAARILQGRDRRTAGPTAPPQGLSLMRVQY